ncbi:MAG: DinB family protein [Defluviitaleaceae bacterium]|nr:DinB family protein [Defluviitaleaceae bacterium]
MIISLKSQLEAWKYERANTVRFLTQLSDEDLKKQLPRKTYTTIFEQIEEMAKVQRALVEGIEKKTLDDVEWDVPVFTDKADLIEKMAQFDAQMEKALEKCDGTEEVDWFGEKKNIHGHLAIMQNHEMMHLGQIIAFCNALDIEIPQEIREAMHLSC